jgi:hypothetical protein
MRHVVVVASFTAILVLIPAGAASAQNKQLELGWLRLGGATWAGLTPLEGSGRAVSGAGDVNGDGYDDFLVGASGFDTVNVDDVGRAWLVYGGLGITGAHGLATAGARFDGEVEGLVGWQTGFAVSAAGDVNADGFDDFLIGAPMAKTPTGTGSGRAYLVYGSATLSGIHDLETFTGCVRINGVNGSDQAGNALAAAGDVDGDGYDDFLVGANGADNGAISFAGATYLIYGSASLPATLNLSTLGAGGVAILGSAASERSGDAVASAGDVNGDTIPDILVGAQFSDPPGKTNAGRAWVVYGSLSLPSTLMLGALGAGGVTLAGQLAGDAFGTKVSGAGDVNCDGLDDVLVSAPLSDPAVGTGNDAGRVYLLYGSATLAASIDAANVGGSVAGVVFTGIDGTATNPSGDRAGSSLAVGGDLNADGCADLLIGTATAGNGAGEAYLIEGGSALPSPFALSAIGARGTVLAGVDGSDNAATSVSFAGDLNADGFTDLLIGAPGGDAGGADAGETIVVHGGCHFIQAVGPVAEGGLLDLHAHGTPGVSNLTFASVLAVGQPPFAPAQPLDTKFGPWWLISQFALFSFSFGANGEMALPLAMPAAGAVPGIVGLTVYMQVLGAEQGDRCDLTSLLGFTIE